MRYLRITGIVLSLILFVWVVVGLSSPVGYHPEPRLLGWDGAFEGDLQLPADKIKKVFDDARKHMIDVNSTGSLLRLIGDLSSWLSFGATAFITLIAGFFGRTPVANGVPADTSGLPARSVRIIAFLAALAAVFTAFGSLATAKSLDYFKRADDARDLIVQSRAEIMDATTSDAAQTILDDLIVKLIRF
jgi:hypothetical protein